MEEDVEEVVFGTVHTNPLSASVEKQMRRSVGGGVQERTASGGLRGHARG